MFTEKEKKLNLYPIFLSKNFLVLFALIPFQFQQKKRMKNWEGQL